MIIVGGKTPKIRKRGECVMGMSKYFEQFEENNEGLLKRKLETLAKVEGKKRQTASDKRLITMLKMQINDLKSK